MALAATAFIAAPLVWYGFRPVDRQNTSLAHGGTAAIGMNAPEARRTRQYWMLSVMALAMALGIAGTVVHLPPERKSVVEGKSVSVSVDIGGRRILTKTNTEPYIT